MEETTTQLARDRVAAAYRRAHDERLLRETSNGTRSRVLGGRMRGRRR